MDANMADSEKRNRNHEPNHPAVYSEQEKGRDRQSRPGDGNPAEAAVKIGQLFLTSEISVPPALVERHQDNGEKEPQRPRRKRAEVKIRKNQHDTGCRDLPRALKNEQDFIFAGGIISTG